MKPTYLMKGNEQLAKFEVMSIENLMQVFKFESMVDNGDHYVLRVPNAH